MVVLYSTGCPRCNVLKKKLDAKGIEYKEVTDVDIMKEKGYLLVPILTVDDEVFDFTEANCWINGIK